MRLKINPEITNDVYSYIKSLKVHSKVKQKLFMNKLGEFAVNDFLNSLGIEVETPTMYGISYLITDFGDIFVYTNDQPYWKLDRNINYADDDIICLCYYKTKACILLKNMVQYNKVKHLLNSENKIYAKDLLNV
jgi:hypothetical protein